MKLKEEYDDALYSAREVSTWMDAQPHLINERSRELGLSPTVKGCTYYWDADQIKMIFDKPIRRPKPKKHDVEIIYVTRETIILESKLNYNEIENL